MKKPDHPCPLCREYNFDIIDQYDEVKMPIELSMKTGKPKEWKVTIYKCRECQKTWRLHR